MSGGDGPDRLRGSGDNDGDDNLSGNTGDDYLGGGVGSDDLAGGSGRDFLEGGAGSDRRAGGEGGAASDKFLLKSVDPSDLDESNFIL